LCGFLYAHLVDAAVEVAADRQRLANHLPEVGERIDARARSKAKPSLVALVALPNKFSAAPDVLDGTLTRHARAGLRRELVQAAVVLPGQECALVLLEHLEIRPPIAMVTDWDRWMFKRTWSELQRMNRWQ